MLMRKIFVYLLALVTAGTAAEKIGVYEYVVKNCNADFSAAADSLESVLAEKFELVGIVDEASPEDCRFRTKVFVVYSPDYAAQLIAANPVTAPFAAVDRINLFEDEAGIHVSIVNPRNILRTVLMDDEKYDDLAEARRQALRSAVLAAVSGETSEKQYGQFRDKGYIGRTMGVMAGGSFDGKIKEVATLNGTPDKMVEALAGQFDGKSGKWGLKVGFKVIDSKLGFAIIGVSSPSIEAKSFEIVKAGSDKERKHFQCPGIAHAGAYPMEVVLVEKEGKTIVRLVNSMYRMKMFFEDAGKMAFAKNMTMPGSIQDDIESAIKSLQQN